LFKLRLGKGTHAFFSSLHRLIGVWSMIFGLIIGITGIWYFMEITVMPDDTIYPPAPEVPQEKMASHGTSPQLLSLDTYIDTAKEVFPELKPTHIYFPGSGYPVEVRGQAGGFLVRDRANAVYLDPFDAEVISIKCSKEDDALSWWVNSADPLHFGYWGGLATKILWAIFGLSLPVLVLSGAYLSLRRGGVVGSKKKCALQKSPFWRRYPIRTWLMLPLLFIFLWWGIEGYNKRKVKVEAPPQTAIAQTEIGPWTASVSREETIYPGNNTGFFIRFQASEGRIANFKNTKLRLIDASRNVVGESDLTGQPHSMWTGIQLPENIDEISHLEVHVTGWDNQMYSEKMPVDFGKAPKTLLAGDERKQNGNNREVQPSTGNVFFSLVYGYIVLSLVIAIGWIVLDRKQSKTNKQRWI